MSPTPPQVVAAFDFDGTLTRRDTLVPYLISALGWPRFLWALFLCGPWLAGYALRLVANDVAKKRLLMTTLKNRRLDEVERWTTRWCDQALPAQLQRWTMTQLTGHQKAGHHCVLVSASPDIYLAPVARRLGFDALICTELEVRGQQFTGALRTPNCYGEQKAIRLREHLAQRFGVAEAGGLEIHAYGDTAGDWPMLKMAHKAWYRARPWHPTPGQHRQAE